MTDGNGLASFERRTALPEPKLHRTLRDVIVETMQAWVRDVMLSHRFARARFNKTIAWKSIPSTSTTVWTKPAS